MPIKNQITPGIKKGQTINASWLNKLRNGNVTGTPPIHVTQQAGNYNISLDPLGKDWFLGKITSDAAGIFTDANYYVRREAISAATSDNNWFAMSDLNDVTVPSDLNIVVVNLPELNATPSDSTHTLPMNRPVVVFQTHDTAHPWKTKYVMWEHPHLCVDDLFDSVSDLSDLSEHIEDITVTTTELSDTANIASDVSVVFATGHMYKDADSDLNPWFAMRLPLCVATGLERASDLSDLSLSDITGDSGGSTDDNFYATGHMYRDTNSDLNPWMVVDLSPGPSAFFISDTCSGDSGCSNFLAGIDLDSVGRVRRVGHTLTQGVPAEWIGPEA